MARGIPFTFIHAADLHLDSPFKGLTGVPDEVRNRLRESTFMALRRLVDTVKHEKIDFVVLAGDLFDAADRSLRAQLRLQRALSEITAQGAQVFIVHGNHDPMNGQQAELDYPQGVHFFGSAEVECQPAYTRSGELAAYIYGISYPTAAVTDNLALRYKKQEGAAFHIALLHANVDGNPAYDNYSPCKLEELVAAGFHYWALGHIHDRRTLHEYPHVVYPGNIQGRSIRETGDKGAYVVSVSDTGSVTMQFQELAEVQWEEKLVSITGLEREQDLKNRLLLELEEIGRTAKGKQESLKPTVVRIRLVGRGSLHKHLLEQTTVEEWLEEIREWLSAPGETECWVWPESITVQTSGLLQLEELAKEEGFLGELLRQGSSASQSSAATDEILLEAMNALRKQPRVREWLDSRTWEEKLQWMNRAMERSVSLLKKEEI